MGASQKLQGEIDRVLKKVQEGVDVFDSIWNKVYDTENANQKEKFEADLKKEIKKLQRYRDQIKTWIQSSEIKDKKVSASYEQALMDARKLIEREMERFKVCEKETKTKAFSKEGLEQQPKTDPKEKTKSETRDWLNNVVGELESQIDYFEADIEGLSVKKGKARPPRLTHLETSISRHKAHIMKLELILRLLDNDELSPKQVNDVKDFLDDYVERNQDDFEEFSDVDELYSSLPLDKVDSLEDLVTIGPLAIVKGIIQGIPSEFSSLGPEDLDAYLEHANEELNLVLTESLTLSDEIEVLTRTCMEDSTRLERALEELDYSLKFVESHDLDNVQMGLGIECPISTEIPDSFMNQLECDNFEVLELDDQIEKTKVDLSSLEDLDCILRRVEAIGQIEDTLTDLKVIEFEGNCIRLSLKTFIPTMEGFLNQPRMDYGTDGSVVDHELLVEVVDGTLELKKMEIFPSDIFIGDIVDAVKSMRHSSSLSFLETRSSLEWAVRKVQTQIILCCLRRNQVKDASKSRHSFEYLDKDETIKAHVVGGIYTFIKIPECWPIIISPLKLISLKRSDEYSNEISLSFLCKVEELVNSLDIHTRQNLSSFVDAIEEILVQQMRSELHSYCTPQQ